MLASVWSSLLKVKTELLGVPVPLISIATRDRKPGRGKHTGVCLFGDLLLAIAEEEELESVGVVRRIVKHVVLSIKVSFCGVFCDLSVERHDEARFIYRTDCTQIQFTVFERVNCGIAAFLPPNSIASRCRRGKD